MPIIVNITAGRESVRQNGPADSRKAKASSAMRPRGLMLFNDSMLVVSVNDRKLLASIEKIDIAELEKEIKTGSKSKEIQKAKDQVLEGRDILVEQGAGVKNKSSMGDCADVRSTRTRICRMLSQSL